MARTGHDAVTFQVLRASLGGVVQEMQQALFRTGYSTIIRESQDASCALLDPDGNVVAQHVVLPLHIGAFAACCRAVLRRFRGQIGPGDAFLINHPYEGGSPHAPDFAVIVPCFDDGQLLGFAASMAHKGDIGGPVPGSCSATARDVFSEGLHLPPVRLERAGRRCEDLDAIVAANSRTPQLVLGDINGQLGCARLGERRIAELVAKHGAGALRRYYPATLAVGARRLRAAVAGWEDGVGEAERFVDDDGVDVGVPLRVHVRVEKHGEEMRFDFSRTADQARGPANIRPPLLRAACGYCLIALVDPGIDINSGLLDAFSVVTRPGSLVDPAFPAPVNTYNPTVHTVIDATFAALSAIVPGAGRADGCASRSFVIGGVHPGTGRRYVQYEIFGGGAGAPATHDGVAGTTVNQTNGRIAAVEIVESEYPVRLRRFELVRDSGGPGRRRGGLAFRREYEQLGEASFALRSTRHDVPPAGAAGGRAGATGSLVVHPGEPGERELAARTAAWPLRPGDVFRLQTPGGGGFGDPLTRPPAEVVDDVRRGYVSVSAAETEYGVVLRGDAGGYRVDEAATRALGARGETPPDGQAP